MRLHTLNAAPCTLKVRTQQPDKRSGISPHLTGRTGAWIRHWEWREGGVFWERRSVWESQSEVREAAHNFDRLEEDRSCLTLEKQFIYYKPFNSLILNYLFIISRHLFQFPVCPFTYFSFFLLVF